MLTCFEQGVIAELFASLQALWLSERRGKGEIREEEVKDKSKELPQVCAS